MGLNTGNIGKHAATNSHKTKVQEKTGGGNQVGLNHYTVAQPPTGRNYRLNKHLRKQNAFIIFV
jgi:hypothetical protein